MWIQPHSQLRIEKSMETYLYFLALILRVGLAVADSCVTSTVSLTTQAATTTNAPTGKNDASEISLEITGCNNITGFPNLTTVARINLYRNNFAELNLTGLRITDQIRIASNPNLETLVLPDPKPGHTISLPPTGTDAPQWTVVEIVDNPLLDTYKIKYQGGSSFWDWGLRNLSRFTFSGGNFHSDFFYPLSGDVPESGHVYVTDSFFLNSMDSTYDCAYLNSLRYHGSFKGNYTCQGKTVVPSLAGRMPISRVNFLGGLVVAFCLVHLLE
ncbi:uncharacterized protein GGS22DRAFT_118298 [Annulohypoxylon maeteangense]|uniref:uncharacterized protein n=1 Tax=Annulohypoxylon maeteangense TaxID=1927788 RepID=UPI002007DF1F|nr:uncharacterized protein GGS22DRAFT_118298 [Annulohypoxylon maeteangense]KAI0886835.1 hypothetical protein GGS22DRAFT_118298 [Annulohypoxylon maeteangense]